MTAAPGPALVTGATGFLGRHLIRALLAEGRIVHALCRDATALAELLPSPQLRIVVGDLEHPESYSARLSPETAVFHLAGVRNAPGTSAARLHAVNVDACLELARRAMQAAVPRMIHVSTALAFGPSAAEPTSEAAGYWKAAAAAYPAARVEAQQALQRLAADGLRLTTVFPSLVFGPDEPSHPNRITRHSRRLLRSGLNVVLAGGRQRRNLVPVSDVVRGMLLAERHGALGGEYILGGEDISPRELGDLVFRLAGRRPPTCVSIPRTVALGVARVADFMARCDPDLGYHEAVRTLLREWRFSSALAEQQLGYRRSPLSPLLRATLDAVN